MVTFPGWRGKEEKSKSFANPQILTVTPENKAKRRFPLGKIFKIIFFPVLIIVLLWYLKNASFLTVKEVTIEGASELNKKTIEDALSGKNILFLRTKNIEANLRKVRPNIAELRIYRGLPDTLKIDVVERQTGLIWKSLDKYFLVDSEGIAYGERGPLSAEEGLVAVADLKNLEVPMFKQIVSSRFVSFVENLLARLKEKDFKVKEIEIGETTFQIAVVLEEGRRIFFDTTQEFNPQFEALNKVFSEKKDEIREYIDVRVIGKVYYK